MLCSTKQETLYTVYINIYIYMCKYIIYIYLFAFYRFLLPFGSVTTIVHFLRQGVGLFFVFFFFFSFNSVEGENPNAKTLLVSS